MPLSSFSLPSCLETKFSEYQSKGHLFLAATNINSVLEFSTG
jgi:hypothetical protein